MSAIAICVELLAASAPLVAAVPVAGIYPGTIPQGAGLPALAVNHISGLPRNTLTGAEATRHRRERVQVTVFAASYPAQKQVVGLVRAALRNQRGAVATFTQVSVLEDFAGPDMKAEPGIFMQTQDFIVSFNEPA